MKRWIWKKHSYIRDHQKESVENSVLLIGFLLFFSFCKIILLYHGYCFALLCIALHCIRWFSIWNDLMNKIFYFIFYSYFFLLNFVYLLVHKFFRISFLDFLCFEREWISLEYLFVFSSFEHESEELKPKCIQWIGTNNVLSLDHCVCRCWNALIQLHLIIIRFSFTISLCFYLFSMICLSFSLLSHVLKLLPVIFYAFICVFTCFYLNCFSHCFSHFLSPWKLTNFWINELSALNYIIYNILYWFEFSL